ncbi:MAG TPA: 16S rRNA (cytosine(1402)-N(4))-methyltransferase RsmH [Vicinamibacterales bacterium]
MTDESSTPHRRRPRYRGTHPRRFHEKYKELSPEKYPETVARVRASGKTPAGAHVAVLVDEVLQALAPKAGETAVDCTLGYGGHARAILARLAPGGKLLGLDVDPVELPRTEARMRALGHGPEAFVTRRSNFAGLPQVLAAEGLAGAHAVLADLGVSSMQLDTPDRGFSVKAAGPLDMRMNPARGLSASELLQRTSRDRLAALLLEGADEPHADTLADALAGRLIEQTTTLADAIRRALPQVSDEARENSVRRVFQALRIAVNDEFSALDTLLRHLPQCLLENGRVAIITFHSGEDRRVKKAFQAGLRGGWYTAIADEPARPSPEECRANPRATAAKLRWARRAGG